MFLNLILILLLVALVAVFVKRKTLPGEGKPIIYALVVIIILAQVPRWIHSVAPKRTKPDYRFTEAAAEQLGRCMSERVKQDGDILVMASPVYTESAQDRLSKQIKALKKGWGHRAFQVVGVDLKPKMPDTPMMDTPFISLEQLVGKWKQHPQAIAIVMLSVMPYFAPNVPLPENLPPLYVFEQSMEPSLRSLMEDGYLDAGIFYGEHVDWRAKPERRASAEDIFNMRYQLITMDDIPPQ